jgi:hypothetical protein
MDASNGWAKHPPTPWLNGPPGRRSTACAMAEDHEKLPGYQVGTSDWGRQGWPLSSIPFARACCIFSPFYFLFRCLCFFRGCNLSFFSSLSPFSPPVRGLLFRFRKGGGKKKKGGAGYHLDASVKQDDDPRGNKSEADAAGRKIVTSCYQSAGALLPPSRSRKKQTCRYSPFTLRQC